MSSTATIGALCAAAATFGFAHTLAGPDHYLPFIAMSRAAGWNLRKTLVITLLCGVGHVLSSVLIGVAGIAVGAALERLRWIEDFRGGMAGWLLLGFGLAYAVWGIRRAIRNRPHTHLHAHADGTIHTHGHTHHADHAHAHMAQTAPAAPRNPADETKLESAVAAVAQRPASLTPWILFTIFVFGPCEPLIPLLMFPALAHNAAGVALVTAVFALTTIATMTAVVTAASIGLTRLTQPHHLLARLDRYAHTVAGLTVAACGAAMTLGL